MNKTRAYLCVGGPYDGRRYACSDLGFRVAKSVRPSRPLSPYNAQISPSVVENVMYVADCFKSHDNTEGTWFWRPHDQPLKKTIEMLLERYEQCNNIIWQETPF